MTLKTNRGRRRRDNGHPESISQQYCFAGSYLLVPQLLGGSSSSVFFLFHTFTDFRIYIKRQGYIYGGFQKGEEKRWKIFVMMMISLHFFFFWVWFDCVDRVKNVLPQFCGFLCMYLSICSLPTTRDLGLVFFLLKWAGRSGSARVGCVTLVYFQWTSQTWSWARKQPKPPHIFVAVLKIYKLQRINHTSLPQNFLIYSLS